MFSVMTYDYVMMMMKSIVKFMVTNTLNRQWGATYRWSCLHSSRGVLGRRRIPGEGGGVIWPVDIPEGEGALFGTKGRALGQSASLCDTK